MLGVPVVVLVAKESVLLSQVISRLWSTSSESIKLGFNLNDTRE